jgi:amino acid adenylation domain-containing protein
MRDASYLVKIASAADRNIDEDNYWLKKLSGELVKSTFPYDYESTSAKEYRPEKVEFVFTGDTYSRLMKISGDSLPRLQMILIAGLDVLLAIYSGNRDIILGTPIYKQEVDTEFINTVLILRNRLREGITFKELIFQVRETLHEANENQNYPVEAIFKELKIPFSRDDDFPLIRIAAVLENIQDKRYIEYIKPDVLFSFSETGERLAGAAEYNASLYSRPTLERIIHHFTRLFREVLFNAGLPVSAVDVLTGEEKKQLLYGFNDTNAGYPADKTIHELFREQAEKTPGNSAVEYNEKQWTYRELNEKSDRLAWFLRNKGVKPGVVVAVMLEHSPEVVAAILGILSAGAAYLPIDPGYPRHRIDYMLKDSNAGILLSEVSEISQLSGRTEERDLPSLITPKREAEPTHPCYVIYTSGSTGKPRGVMIAHRSLVNYVWWAAGNYVKGQGLSFPLYTNLSFDLTVTSIFTPLITGNTIIVYGGENREIAIEKIVDDGKAGIVKLTPSHLKLIRDKKIKSSSIRCFILGGEELDTSLARDTGRNFHGAVEIYNEYGPTEAAVGCMIYKYDPEKDNKITVPIGGPINNTQIYLLDENQKPVPPGVAGEMYVSGDGVAVGYINRVELTAEKFPLNAFLPGARMYRTGDLARRLPGGGIEFLGRMDTQVKIRGFRVELGEIERRLSEYDKIKNALVISRKNSTGDKELFAYIVSAGELSVSALREFLSHRLPFYMIPSYYVLLDKIPLTPNGKVDTRALPEAKNEVLRERAEYVPPRSDLEEKLVELWKDILGVEGIGIIDNFFDLGGDSLKAIRMARKLNEDNIDITVDKIFLYPTINKISSYLQDKTGITGGDAFESVRDYLLENYGDRIVYEKYQLNNVSCCVLFMPDNGISADKVSEEIRNTFGDGYYPNFVRYVKNRDEIIGPERIDNDLFANMLQLKTLVTKEQEEEISRELNKNDRLTSLLKENFPGREYPVSPLQRFYLLNMKSISTNITFFSCDFSYPVDAAEIRQILIRLAKENSLLRSVIVNKDNDYFIKEFGSFLNIEFPFVDVSGFSLTAKEDISDLVRRNLYTPFDMVESLLYRIILFKWDEKTHKLFIVFNHLIFDGESHKILRERIDNMVRGADTGEIRKDFSDYVGFLKGIGAEVPGLEQHIDLSAYIECSEKANKNFKTGNLKYDGFDIDLPVLQGDLMDFYNEIVLMCFARLVGTLFEMEEVPIMLISNGRNYKDGNFNNIIGDFHDYVPVLFSFGPGSTPGRGLENYLNYKQYIMENNLNFMNFFVKKYISGINYVKVFSNPFVFNTEIGQYDYLKRSFSDHLVRELNKRVVSRPSFEVVMSKDLYSDKLWVSWRHNWGVGDMKIEQLFMKHYKDFVDYLNGRQTGSMV